VLSYNHSSSERPKLVKTGNSRIKFSPFSRAYPASTTSHRNPHFEECLTSPPTKIVEPKPLMTHPLGTLVASRTVLFAPAVGPTLDSLASRLARLLPGTVRLARETTASPSAKRQIQHWRVRPAGYASWAAGRRRRWQRFSLLTPLAWYPWTQSASQGSRGSDPGSRARSKTATFPAAIFAF
jgi:hypothetical protein